MILPPPSGQPVHVPNYHAGYLFHTEMSSTVYPRGCGWERDGSTCTVHAPLLFVHALHLRGCVRERYKPRHNAQSIPMPPLSSTTNHHHTPLLFTLSHISRDIISFYTWDYSRKGQSQQVFYKKCILMFRAMHGSC